MSTDRISEYLAQFSQTRTQMLEQLRRVIVGQADVIEQILAAIFTPRPLPAGRRARAWPRRCMVSSISQILDVSFKRIQFTPDLMPSDITGTTVLDEHEHRPARVPLRQGPIFANIILADEINRTPPKTQAALLAGDAGTAGHRRAGDVTTCRTRSSSSPRRTRSSRKAPIRCPKPSSTASCSTSRSITRRSKKRSASCSTTTKDEPPELTKVLSGKAIMNLQKLVRSVPVGDYVIDYVARLVRATRPRDPTAPDFVRKMVDWGAGPRAGQFLIQGGKALAAMDGRFSVAIDDIRRSPSRCCATASAPTSRPRPRGRPARTSFNSC